MDLYFNYKDQTSKRIIFYINDNKLTDVYSINFLDTDFYVLPNNIKQIPLLVDHRNKKIIKSTDIINYLINNVRQINKQKNFKSINNEQNNEQGKIQSKSSKQQIKPFIPFESGTFQYYNFF